MTLRLLTTSAWAMTVLALAACTPPAPVTGLPNLPPTWLSLGGGALRDVSGMALVDGAAAGGPLFLVVHDSKSANQPRAALVQHRGAALTYQPLRWKGADPIDLEAVTRLPGTSDFIAATSAGQLFVLVLDRAQLTITPRHTFDVPEVAGQTEIESFEVQLVEGQPIAAWAGRGASSEPALLSWSRFDARLWRFGPVETTPVRVPWPTAHVRHLSDLKISTDGVVLSAAASDPGDRGPFQGAVYRLGRFTTDDGIRFTPEASLEPFFKTEAHKIEALERHGESLAIGSDDEALGSSLSVLAVP